MYCVKNRIYCHDCDRSFIDSKYPNQLRSQGHIDNVMKNRCCSCNNHDLVVCIEKLSLKSDVDIQANFSVEQVRSKKQTKQTNNYKNIDPNVLIDLFTKNYIGCYNGDETIAEAKAFLGKLRRVRPITCEQHKKFHGKCFVKSEQI